MGEIQVATGEFCTRLAKSSFVRLIYRLNSSVPSRHDVLLQIREPQSKLRQCPARVVRNRNRLVDDFALDNVEQLAAMAAQFGKFVRMGTAFVQASGLVERGRECIPNALDRTHFPSFGPRVPGVKGLLFAR